MPVSKGSASAQTAPVEGRVRGFASADFVFTKLQMASKDIWLCGRECERVPLQSNGQVRKHRVGDFLS